MLFPEFTGVKWKTLVFIYIYRHAEDTASQSYQQPVHNLTVFHRLLTHIPAGYTPVFYQKPRILFTTLWFITFVHSKNALLLTCLKERMPQGATFFNQSLIFLKSIIVGYKTHTI